MFSGELLYDHVSVHISPWVGLELVVTWRTFSVVMFLNSVQSCCFPNQGHQSYYRDASDFAMNVEVYLWDILMSNLIYMRFFELASLWISLSWVGLGSPCDFWVWHGLEMPWRLNTGHRWETVNPFSASCEQNFRPNMWFFQHFLISTLPNWKKI